MFRHYKQAFVYETEDAHEVQRILGGITEVENASIDRGTVILELDSESSALVNQLAVGEGAVDELVPVQGDLGLLVIRIREPQGVLLKPANEYTTAPCGECAKVLNVGTMAGDCVAMVAPRTRVGDQVEYAGARYIVRGETLTGMSCQFTLEPLNASA
jgi:hypothetical protein